MLQGELFERQYNKPRGGQERLVRKGQITYRQGELNTSSGYYTKLPYHTNNIFTITSILAKELLCFTGNKNMNYYLTF